MCAFCTGSKNLKSIVIILLGARPVLMVFLLWFEFHFSSKWYINGNECVCVFVYKTILLYLHTIVAHEYLKYILLSQQNSWPIFAFPSDFTTSRWTVTEKSTPCKHFKKRIVQLEFNIAFFFSVTFFVLKYRTTVISLSFYCNKNWNESYYHKRKMFALLKLWLLVAQANRHCLKISFWFCRWKWIVHLVKRPNRTNSCGKMLTKQSVAYFGTFFTD